MEERQDAAWWSRMKAPSFTTASAEHWTGTAGRQARFTLREHHQIAAHPVPDALEEEGRIALNASLDTYLPELEGTDMGSGNCGTCCPTARGFNRDSILPRPEDSTAFSPVRTEVHPERIDACFMRPPGAIPSGTASSLLK